MKIAPDTIATLHYVLKEAGGELIESSRQADGEPLTYLHGSGTMIPGLEDKLEGKSKGDKLSVDVSAEEAYGERDEELIETVEKSEFDDAEELTEGKEFQYDDEDGNVFHVRIVKIEGDKVTVDGNHPLAGKNLHFDIEVLDVRAATAEELEHGHAHGEGGHHH